MKIHQKSQSGLKLLIFIVFVVVCLFVGENPVLATLNLTKGTTEGDFTYSLNNGNVTIEKFNGAGGDVVIPSKLGGYPVTNIGGNAFTGCKGLKSVVIPTSVTKIDTWINTTGYILNDDDYGAFSNCTGLTSVTIPSSVKSIGYQAFLNCTSLTGVTIPEGVTSLDGGVFEGCSGLTSVSLPASLTTYIGGSQFYKCTNLKTVDLPVNMSEVTNWEFRGCTSLTTVKIPAKVKKISWGAFGDCTALTKVDIPTTVTEITDGAFFNCNNLTIFGQKGSIAEQYAINHNIPFMINDYQFTEDNSGVTFTGYIGTDKEYSIPSTLGGRPVTSIGESALANYPGQVVSIPDSVTSIQNRAFENSSLANIAIPDNVTSIGDYVFSDCGALTYVTIGKGVTHIGTDIFKGDFNMYLLTVDENNPSYTVQDGVLFNKDKTTLIKFLCNKSESYVIPDGVTTIGDYAFQNCDGLTDVTIPESVIKIGNEAFNACDKLENVYFKGDAPQIGEYLFDDTMKTFKVHYISGKTGFTDPWAGCKTTSYYGPPVEWIVTAALVVVVLVGGVIVVFILRKRKKQQAFNLNAKLDDNEVINEASESKATEGEVSNNEDDIDKEMKLH